MRLDVRSLRRFNRLANTGAERAAQSLTTLAGIDTRVGVTRVELDSYRDITREFEENELVSVEIGFEGGLDGVAVLAFTRESANRLLETLVPGTTNPDDELAVSSLEEVGNIMIGGFVDGWADYLETPIDISTPTLVEVDGDGPLSETAGQDDGAVFAFRNQLEATDAAVNFHLFMIPRSGSIGTVVDPANADRALPISTYQAFGDLIAEGGERASEHITTMTSIPTSVDVSRLSFVPIEAVPASLADETRTGVVLEFEGLPSGYIAILFDEESASNVASALLPVPDADEEMRQSAIQEIGNIVTSGFLDGWADALDTTIEISPPTFVNDLGSAIVDPLVTDLAQSQEFAFLIDSTIRTENDEFTCDIYALPDERELRRALEQLVPA